MKPVDRHCRYCAHWLRWDPSDAAVCGLDKQVQIVAQPERGCAYWQREPGADDDLAPPLPYHRPTLGT